MRFRLLAVVALAGHSILAQPVYKVWDIWKGGTCYSQDFGSVVHYPGWDRWLLYYGAVSERHAFPSSNQPDACTCGPGSYTEDIWLTWSTSNGTAFGQVISGIEPPLLVLSSSDFSAWCATHGCSTSGGNAGCTGYVIGDAAVARSDTKNKWFMYFDVQSCTDIQNSRAGGIYLATSVDADYSAVPYQIVGKLDLPGVAPLSFPSLYRDPSDGSFILSYFDRNVTIRAVRIDQTGSGLTYSLLNAGGSALTNLPVGGVSANKISVYRSGSSYYAFADRFGLGCPEDLKAIYRLGPSSTPYSFDWNSRRSFVSPGCPGTFDSSHIEKPFAVGPDYTGDGTTRCFFWAKGNFETCPPNPCDSLGHTSTGMVYGDYVQSTAACTYVPTRLHTLTPCRLFDSRDQVPPYNGLPQGYLETRTYSLNGICSIPAGASAVSLNVTVVSPTTSGSLSVSPGTYSCGPASTISFAPGVVRGNNAVIKVCTDQISIKNNQTSGSTHIILDVNGYFAP